MIQCKRWAQHKVIHEKHVFQLFGTVVAMRIERPDARVRGAFVTTTSLSERAREFARQLEIVVGEQFPLADYPRIKCNVARRSDERIYHLPFDQQRRTPGSGCVQTGGEAGGTGAYDHDVVLLFRRHVLPKKEGACPRKLPRRFSGRGPA